MIGFSFVGTGLYKVTKYSYLDKECETNFFPIALSTFYPLEKHIVLMTKEAKEMHFEKLKNVYPNFTAVEIPSGKSETEFWEIFKIISENIEAGSEVCFDITHGFRSQPVIAIACMIFLKTINDVKIKDILYGAFEAKDVETNITPVFSLLPFMDLIDWSNAVNNMLNFGNAKMLQKLLRTVQANTYINNSELRVEHLSAVGTFLNKISVDFSTLRVKDFKKDLNDLMTRIDEFNSEERKPPQAYPTKILLKKTKQIFDEIPATDYDKSDNISTLVKVIDFLLNTQQYQQAITLMRELIISYLCFLNNREIIDDRHLVEDNINNAILKNRNTDEKIESEIQNFKIPDDLIDIWSKITEIRNDINHAAYNKKLCQGNTIIENTKNYFKNIKDFLINNPINADKPIESPK